MQKKIDIFKILKCTSTLRFDYEDYMKPLSPRITPSQSVSKTIDSKTVNNFFHKYLRLRSKKLPDVKRR